MQIDILRAALYLISFIFGIAVALNILATRHFLAKLFGLSELTRAFTVGILLFLMLDFMVSGEHDEFLRTITMTGVSIINVVSSLTLYIAFCKMKGSSNGGSS